jgi:phosphoenolpyruvate-protein phosphotransferase
LARELRFRFPLAGGLHARPATALREAAAVFHSTITLTNRRTGRTADARSVLALVATLARYHDDCTLRIAGDDEADAMAGMQRFVAAELPLCDEEEPQAAPAAGAGRPLPRLLRGEGVQIHRGVPASGGVGRGRAVVLAERLGPPDVARYGTRSAEEETAMFEGALAEAGAQGRRGLRAAGNATERAIVEARLVILEDAELRKRTLELIRSGGLSAGRAVVATAEHFARIMRNAGSVLLAERALDLRDVAATLVRLMYPDLVTDERIALHRGAVLVAEALSPAQFLALDRSRLAGIVLARGGVASHTAILARAHGVPCVTGVAGAVQHLRDGQDVIVDGERGLVVADPAPAVERFFAAQASLLRAMRERLERVAARPAATADGRRIRVAANVGSLPEVRLAFASGAEGIGLFRTELLFLDRAEAPSEEEQAAVYAEAARLAEGRPVVIRTLDAGGDKPIPYLKLPEERNPFLGFRGIRIYDAHPEIAAAQVRAILRASAAGNVEIMFPMVGSLEELRALRGLVGGQMAALESSAISFDPDIAVGIMVEVPALAFFMDRLAAEVDFFSIGSNDLLQYLLAVDRDGERVAHLYDPYRPAFLRALEAICAAARAHGRPIGLCGELGGDPLAVPLLVGLGLCELSVAPAHVATVKSAIADATAAECGELATAVTASGTSVEVKNLLRGFAARKAGATVLAEDLVRLRSESRSKEEAIRELVDLLRLAGRVSDADLVEDAVWRREETYSTGVGFGLAIPHCTSEGVLATSIAVATYETGMEWQALDGAPVRMAMLIAVGADTAQDAHLKMIAELSRRLMDDEFRRSLLVAGNAAEVVDLLRGAVAVE